MLAPNGAGKSTTINLILDGLKKDNGHIEIFGKENTDYSIRENIGVAFDECKFHDFFNASDIGKIMSGVYKSWDKSLYEDFQHKFNIPEKQQIGSFSKGMKMKLSIICALSHKPKLLILDEATSGLDPVVRDEILGMFMDFIQDEECSVFFSSHITSDIQKIADYIILIHQGNIIFEESKDTLIYNYGILKCGKNQFSSISPDDYIKYRNTNVSVECLVRNKEDMKRKYTNSVVDNATLEDIMLFYVKGGAA